MHLPEAASLGGGEPHTHPHTHTPRHSSSSTRTGRRLALATTRPPTWATSRFEFSLSHILLTRVFSNSVCFDERNSLGIATSVLFRIYPRSIGGEQL